MDDWQPESAAIAAEKAIAKPARVSKKTSPKLTPKVSRGIASEQLKAIAKRATRVAPASQPTAIARPETFTVEAAQSIPKAPSQQRIEITPIVDTLGIGASIAIPVSEHIKARVSFNILSLPFAIGIEGVTFDAKAALLNLLAEVDYYPFSSDSSFSITGSIAYQTNRVKGLAEPGANGAYSFKNQQYTTT